MGSVWIARHIELDVDVAVKFRISDEQLEAKAEARFKREAQAAAQLKSPNVVHIYDYGIDQGTPYIAMELLEGEDLADLLDREAPLSLARAAELIRQAGKALSRAHQCGIVHRDIKPSNLFLVRHDGDETLKVLDFGIAKEQTSEGEEATTSTGTMLGSPSYMSPEQARGRAVDQRADVWSLAAVLYRMLTGVPPFAGANSQDILIKICTENAPSPSAVTPDLPSSIDAFFERALSRQPEQRFQSVEELVHGFDDLVLDHPDATRRNLSRRAPTVGRNSDTESLAAPLADTSPILNNGSGKLRYAWIIATIAALSVIGIALSWATARRSTSLPNTSTIEPSLTTPASARLSNQAATPVTSSAPVNPSASSAPQTATQAPTQTASGTSVESAKPPRVSKPTPKPSATQVIDPVFGLPVPVSSRKTP